MFLCSYVVIAVSAYAHEALGHGVENKIKSIYINISEDVSISNVTNEENTVIFPRLRIQHSTAVAYIGRKRPIFFVWSIVTCDGAGQELRTSLRFRIDLIGHSRTGLNRPDSLPIDEESGGTAIIDDLKPKLLTSEADQEPTGWIYSNTRVDNFYKSEGTLQLNERAFGYSRGMLGGTLTYRGGALPPRRLADSNPWSPRITDDRRRPPFDRSGTFPCAAKRVARDLKAPRGTAGAYPSCVFSR